MGVFDYVACNYPLPVVGIVKCEFQSYDTPAQYLEHFDIREDGTLWENVCDKRFEKTDDLLGFCIHRDNPRWEQVVFNGEIEINGSVGSFKLWFRDGVVRDVIATPSEPEE